MGCIDDIDFDLSLARGLDYYTGVIYEAVLIGGKLSRYPRKVHRRPHQLSDTYTHTHAHTRTHTICNVHAPHFATTLFIF